MPTPGTVLITKYMILMYVYDHNQDKVEDDANLQTDGQSPLQSPVTFSARTMDCAIPSIDEEPNLPPTCRQEMSGYEKENLRGGDDLLPGLYQVKGLEEEGRAGATEKTTLYHSQFQAACQ